MSKASKKYTMLEEYLGYATLLEIAHKHNISQAYVAQAAKELCLEYARTLPRSHPLKKRLDGGFCMQRYEWREYTQDILDYVQNKYIHNSSKSDLSPSMKFWSQLDTRAQKQLSTVFNSADMIPACHEKFEREVIFSLLKMDAGVLLCYKSLGRRTLLTYAKALSAAGYLENPKDFSAYHGTQNNSGIYQEKTPERGIKNRDRRILKKFEAGIHPVQIAKEDNLSIQDIARIIENAQDV
jgi:hypothetical protein